MISIDEPERDMLCKLSNMSELFNSSSRLLTFAKGRKFRVFIHSEHDQFVTEPPDTIYLYTELGKHLRILYHIVDCTICS